MQKKQINKKQKRAFTLAEVLLALAIVGVIATIAIPAVINDANNHMYVAGLKKFYGVFSQAIQKYTTDEGSTGDLSKTTAFTDSTFCEESEGTTYCYGNNATSWARLSPYFNLTKDCGAEDKGCGWTFSSGQVFANAVLSDGMIINISFLGACNTKDRCATLYVDINGLSPPNKPGKDEFEFYIMKNATLQPIGSTAYKYTGSPTQNPVWNGTGSQRCNTGKIYWSCTARVIEEGWQMTY